MSGPVGTLRVGQDGEGVLALPEAVVFDCDGTLADTESIADRAWDELLRAHGYTPTPADFKAVVGHPFPQNWAYFATRVDLGDRDRFRARLRARFGELFDTELVVHEDAVTTMRRVAELGVPVAVASSSSHAHVDRVLDRAGVADLVQLVIGADDVTEHKPLPGPYLAAARGLAVAPERSVAVEDTHVGVASARAAGMFTVAVVRDHQTADDLAEADRVVYRLTAEVVVARA